MKAYITITDDDGAVFEGDVEFAPARAARAPKGRAKAATKVKRDSKTASAKLDFTKSERAFVKSYVKGLSGPKKFVLLIAYLTKGQAGKEVQLQDVQQRWNRMTVRLGKFNRFYTNEAKENGWVDTKKKGGYVLTASWREILEG
jgi:hypothetical protein